MEIGFFTMPIHPLDKDYRKTLDEDRQAFLLADELGFSEAYCGEHVTDAAENITSSTVFIASLAAATIPITISATLAVMYMLGMELNTVTLAALIVVLGIVVDDPIVVIDNYIEKLDEGESRWNAAYHSAKELFPSVFTATLAISA